MTHSDMRLFNAENVFNCVASGKGTIHEISQEISLSHQAVKNICLDYVKKGVFILNKISNTNIGRKLYSFSVCDKFFTAYIDEYLGCFSIIFINANNRAIDRIEHGHKETMTLKENLDAAITKVTSHKDYKYCVHIYLNCSDEYEEYLPYFVTRIKEQEFLIEAYKNNTQIITFDFKNEIYLSLKGDVRKTNATISEICKVLTPDKIYTFHDDELVGDIMNALPLITTRKTIEKIINK